MSTAETAPLSAAELKLLFSDLASLSVLLLAVSGGPDSTALMVLAARWRQTLKRKPALLAVTIDHGLRAESASEAAEVGKLAHKLGISHRILRWTGKKPRTGLQQAARLARYRLLAEAARAASASHILTAHTLDDQAETVLIRMARGSGLTGLAAMRKLTLFHAAWRAPSPLGGEGRGEGAKALGSAAPHPTSALRAEVNLLPLGRREEGAAPLYLVRPLLDTPKSRLVATLKAAKIPFAEDPSNRDPRFTRVRLRTLMPGLAREGLSARRLALLARRLSRANFALEAAVDRAMAEVADEAPDRIAFQAQGFSRLPDEIALRLIGRAVTLLGDEGPVELGKLEALYDALDAAQSTGARFRRSLAGALVTLGPGQIIVERAPSRHGRTLTTCKAGRAGRPKSR